MPRTPLAQRKLPNYSRGQEWANTITHIVGGGLGLAVLLLVLLYCRPADPLSLGGGLLYAISLIALYAVSSIYHGLRPEKAKKVMQVIDHCTIYLLIAGSYTPILLAAMRPMYPTLAWVLFGAEWALAAFATVFTAIDHKRYGALSMTCYILMGWLIIFACKPALLVLGGAGFALLLAGGIAYTVGSILYGIGSRIPAFHIVFHCFVLLGSLLHAAAIVFFVL